MAVASVWCLVLVALEGCWARSTHGQSPHEQGLRSSPELPLPDLIESPLKKYDPGLQDLNATELHLILGKGFHPGFMSVSQPPAPPRGRKRNYWWKRRRRKGRPSDRPQSVRGFLDEGHPSKSSVSNDSRSRLPPWITEHLTPEPPTTAARRRRGGRKRGGGGGGGGGPGGRGRRRKDDGGGGGSGRWRRRLRRLLLSITHCPVRWTWKDVGIRFWPRWIKEGRCGGRAPPGEDEEEDGGEIAGPPGGVLGKGGALRKGKNRRRNEGHGVIPLPRRKNAVPRGMRREPGRRRDRPGADAGEKRGKRPGGRQRRRRKEKRPATAAEEEANAVGDPGSSRTLTRAGRGRRAWPGEDGNEGPEPTCSIPAGMVCRPARKRRITLLRWHCREWKDLGEALAAEGSGGKASWGAGGEENNNNNLKCQWIKVEYPIVTECSCQCPK